MKKYVLTRTAKTDHGVYGTLKEEFKEPFAVTYELPWHDNKRNISCIPLGLYVAKRARYKNKYDAFILLDVPGRSGIFMHVGNSIQDTRGCPLIGEAFEPVRLKNRKIVPGILCSKKGFGEFMGTIGKETVIELQIVEDAYA